MIKSFRGLIQDEGQDTIPLRTNNGSTGYTIKKLQIVTDDPTDNSNEYVFKVYSIPQVAVTDEIDFSDQTLLAIAYWSNSSTAGTGFYQTVVFDNMVFNQDIYLTASGDSSARPLNYYIELEQMSLSLNESTVATLKDIRNIEARFGI